MEIRVELPRELVSRLHADHRSERDKRIRLALEEYLEVPILDMEIKAGKQPKKATKHRKTGTDAFEEQKDLEVGCERRINEGEAFTLLRLS